MDSQTPQPEAAAQRRQILALVKRVERRVRFQRALERGTAGGVVYLMLMAVVVTLYTTLWMSWDTLVILALALAALPIGMALWGWFSNIDRVALAQRIDRANDLHDRLSTALSLLEAGKDDAFVRAQIRDALAHQDKVDTAIAAPFRRPTDLVPFGIFLVALILLSFFRPPSHTHPLPEPLIIKHDRVLSASTLAIERDRLEQMKKALSDVEDPRVQALLDEMESLLDDVENQEISEKEFLERIDQIEEKYFNTLEDETTEEIADKLKKAAEELEKEASEELKKHEELQEAIDAFKEKDLSKASDALNKLAEKLKDKDISKEDAERLAKLMESFADKIDLEDPALKALAEKHRDLIDSLSKKLDMKGNLSADEKNQLDRAKEKLDDIEKRQKKNQERPANRQLKQIRRNTKDMAKKLKEEGEKGQNTGEKGEKGEQKDPNAKQEGQKDKQGEQSKKGEQGKKGEEKGNDGKEGKDSQDSQKDGQSSPREQAGKMAEDAAEALKKGGEQQKSRELREQAKKQLDQMKETMRRSSPQESDQDGEESEAMRKFLERAKGEQDGEGKEAGANKNKPMDKPGGGDAQEANGAGEGEGNKELGEATKMDSQGKDTKLEGADGDGPTKSEIISAASEEGFATTEYKDVYVDYESVVEEVMDREEVPAGYRYYIKRYFELIKPRD
ncbi:hypothetical protein [Bradymonas sediminis]|uniref:Uncharacterized protein n=1 Tax=Bradymonas sediminis TaxID=1548548 RepID=A0A2Z4FIX6_9DELT|nr:hypothetical protein [Bradymonas sediminis]AWV88977.1 hypothetical protein DN745_06325 [Bradymonas sediminis]TDP71988.1 hypothetical protein DFR33_108202 [Bradymonas sediminis]